MLNSYLKTDISNYQLSLYFYGEFDIHLISNYKNQIEKIEFKNLKKVYLDFSNLDFLDTAAAIFIRDFQKDVLSQKNIEVEILSSSKDITDTLELVKKNESVKIVEAKEITLLEKLGKKMYTHYTGIASFVIFLGQVFVNIFYYIKSFKTIRYREILFEINESAIKALAIVSITSFLIGLVVAYQSAYQLKLYGANIFIVDMLGISILRELSPLITAIVIAGRSGSAFTAQIGAMKITQELDAMKTMGFDPFRFLVLPRIIALIIAMPIMIFVSDIMAILGGMIIANVDLAITADLFLDRFNSAVDIKHFYIGIVKGPFFAFLIATIGIYRGMMVKDDTQSIGFNTTKSVVESIFAVIICDAVFSIAFTNLGI
jgi:phospholipid/cholesterol/gamma-HCH transport system permease protein